MAEETNPPKPVPDAPSAPAGRNAILAGASATALGLGLAGTVERAGGGLLVVIGWVLLLYGIHTFGRRA